jgi:endonuclease YncB( thermonuclease family)
MHKKRSALGLIVMVLSSSPIHAADLSGTIRVVDGDSLVVGGERVRLEGIDAPEMGQTCERLKLTYNCGQEARDLMVMLVSDGSVHCQVNQRDIYRRWLGQCFGRDPITGDAIDLNLQMVGRGYAVVYHGHGTPALLQAEREAKAAHRGIWAGHFDYPWDWRKNHKH